MMRLALLHSLVVSSASLRFIANVKSTDLAAKRVNSNSAGFTYKVFKGGKCQDWGNQGATQAGKTFWWTPNLARQDQPADYFGGTARHCLDQCLKHRSSQDDPVGYFTLKDYSTTWYSNEKECFCYKKNTGCKHMVSDSLCTTYKIEPGASVLGDPHAANLRGETFNILSLGQVNLIIYPQGSMEFESKLVIRSLIQQSGVHCHETFMKEVSISGSWFNNDTFTFKDDEDTGEVLVFKNDFPHSLGSNESSKPGDPQIKFMDKRQISFKPSQSKTEVVVFSEGRVHQGQGIYLNLQLSGFAALPGAVGGLLGLDDHESEMKLDRELCQQGGGDEKKEAVRMAERLKGENVALNRGAPALHAEVEEVSLEDVGTSLFHISIN